MPRVTAIFDADATKFNSTAKQVSATGDKITKQFSAKQQLFAAETKLMVAIPRGDKMRVAELTKTVNLLKQEVQQQASIASLAQKIGRDQKVTTALAVGLAKQRLVVEQSISRELDRQSTRAREYAKRGVQIPGGRVPAVGGKGKGGGYSKGQDLTDAYNIGQDVVQGGIGAAANNVPRAIQLAKQLPALVSRVSSSIPVVGKLLGVIAGFGSYAIVKGHEIATASDQAFETNALARAAAAAKKTADDKAKAEVRDTAAAHNQGAGAIALGGIAAGRLGQMRDRDGSTEELARLRADTARAALEAIADEDQRTRAMRDHDINELKRRQQAEEEGAQRRLEAATVELKTAEALFDVTSKRIRALEAKSRTPAESKELSDLKEGKIGGVTQRAAQARELHGGAIADRNAAVEARLRAQEEIRLREIDALGELDQRSAERRREAVEAGNRRAEEVAKTEMDRLQREVGSFLTNIGDGIKTLADESKRKAEEQNGTRQHNEDAEVSGLRGRGRERQANRLQRKIDIERGAEQLQSRDSSLSEEQARRMATRDANNADPTRANRIRTGGSTMGFTGLDDRRSWSLDRRAPSRLDRDPAAPSALDWIKPGKDTIKGAGFKGPKPERDKEASPMGTTTSPLLNALVGLTKTMASDIAELRKNAGIRAINK